jgi:hypothetical protein
MTCRILSRRAPRCGYWTAKRYMSEFKPGMESCVKQLRQARQAVMKLQKRKDRSSPILAGSTAHLSSLVAIMEALSLCVCVCHVPACWVLFRINQAKFFCQFIDTSILSDSSNTRHVEHFFFILGCSCLMGLVQPSSKWTNNFIQTEYELEASKSLCLWRKIALLVIINLRDQISCFVKSLVDSTYTMPANK